MSLSQINFQYIEQIYGAIIALSVIISGLGFKELYNIYIAKNKHKADLAMKQLDVNLQIALQKECKKQLDELHKEYELKIEELRRADIELIQQLKTNNAELKKSNKALLEDKIERDKRWERLMGQIEILEQYTDIKIRV